MAFEKIPVKRADFRAKVEATYGTNPGTGFATGTIGIETLPATGETITVAGTELLAAGAARTPGSDDYNDTLATAVLLSAEITAAINDVSNSWTGIVTATDLSGTVLITSDTAGDAGRLHDLTSSLATVYPVTGTGFLTGAGLEAGAAIYVEAYEASLDDNLKKREGMSPFGPGHKAYPTLRKGAFSGSVHVSPLTLTVGTELPVIDPLLRLVGFGVGVAASPVGSKTLTYAMKAHGQGSSTLELREYDEANANAVYTTMSGCRAQGTLKMVGDDAVVLDFDGMAASVIKTDLGVGPATLTYADICPVVGGAGTVTITEVLGNKAFGGLLYDIEAGFYGVQESNGLGTRVINMRPGAEGVEISLNMEQQTLDDFDIHAFILAKSSLQVHIELPTAVAGGDSVEVDFLAQVLTAESQEAPAGNQTWSLGAVVIFPEVGSDEGGLVPVSDTFTLTYRTTD